MKKCDLHIHTISTPSDRAFTFSMDALKEYVHNVGLDVIAITNHNIFNYSQYSQIREELTNVIVLPGIEIDLESGHILVIGNRDEQSLFAFNAKCEDINRLIPDAKTYITYSQFVQIFSDLNEYLLIPHYDKKPHLPKEIIERFGKHILAGEVSSVKKFIYMQKDANEVLTPLRFSDMRVFEGMKVSSCKAGFTYIDVEDVDVSSLRLCLMDKTKSTLSKENGNELFQIFNNGQMLSTGLNIMYGKRSSGKTYFLDRVAEIFGDRAKYIRQFELLGRNSCSQEQFESDERIRQDKYVEEYFKEFQDVVSDFLQLSSQDVDDANIVDYMRAVHAAAQESDINDEFSKTALFNASLLHETSTDELSKLLRSVKKLIDTQMYRAIIERHVSLDSLISLFKELYKSYSNNIEDNRLVEISNSIIKDIKSALQLKSAAPRIPDLDLYGILLREEKRKRFIEISNNIKRHKVIHEDRVGRFIIKIDSRPFINASDVKTIYNKQCSLTAAFRQYADPVKYIAGLVSAGVELSQIYKLFAFIEYKILNSSGLAVSGGERAEFNFIQKIKDSLLCDILLIDEPESSFDNIFLKSEVNSFIKEMADIMPVIVSTHNSTIGGSIKPDYVLYTEKSITNGNTSFAVYSGVPTAVYLHDINGNKKENYITTLNSLEAGVEAYNERKNIYETLKNRK